MRLFGAAPQKRVVAGGRRGAAGQRNPVYRIETLIWVALLCLCTRVMAVHEHEVARAEGDGAGDEIDDLYDGEEYQTKDQRAETRTTFYERDIDKHCTSRRQANQLKRALRLHEGERKPNRGQENYKEDKRRLIGIIGSQLDLTNGQKQRVKHLVMDVMSVNSFGYYSSEQVILATVNVVVREDGRWIEDEDDFRDYMEQVGITNDEDRADLDTMKRLRGLVRDRIPSKS